MGTPTVCRYPQETMCNVRRRGTEDILYKSLTTRLKRSVPMLVAEQHSKRTIVDLPLLCIIYHHGRLRFRIEYGSDSLKRSIW